MNFHLPDFIIMDAEASTRIGVGAIVAIIAIAFVSLTSKVGANSAIKKFKAELEKANPDINMIHDFAAFYLNKKMHNEALPVIKRGLEIEPENISLLFMMSNTLCLYDRDKEAMPFLKRLADIIIQLDETDRRKVILNDLTERDAAFVTYRLSKILEAEGENVSADYYKLQTKRFVSPELAVQIK